jgi:antitoxin component of MazEF toxin-antitoxin module
METLVKAKQVGGSLMVTIPKGLVEEEGIRPGDLLRVDVEKARKDWFGAFKGLKPMTREEELDTHD